MDPALWKLVYLVMKVTLGFLFDVKLVQQIPLSTVKISRMKCNDSDNTNRALGVPKNVASVFLSFELSLPSSVSKS